jgi:hypothetical protein
MRIKVIPRELVVKAKGINIHKIVVQLNVVHVIPYTWPMSIKGWNLL